MTFGSGGTGGESVLFCRWEQRRHSHTVCFFCYHMASPEVGREAIRRHVYCVSVFAFIFQVRGQRCHICPSYGAERGGGWTSSRLSDILEEDVLTWTQTSAPPPCYQRQHNARSKQQAGRRGNHLVTECRERKTCDAAFQAWSQNSLQVIVKVHKFFNYDSLNTPEIYL